MRLLRWVMVLMALVALTAYACGGGDDDNGDGGNGGDGDGGDVTGSCGDVPGIVGGVSDDLSDDFPDDFPIYDGADFKCGYNGESNGVSGVAGIWGTGDDIDDVKTFYDDELGGDGPWTAASDGTSAGSSFWIVSHDDGKGGIVTVTEDGDDVAITVVISDDLNDLPNGDGDSSDGDSGSDDDDSSSDGDSGDDDGPTSDNDPGIVDGDLPEEVDLPDDFPTDVPLPDDIRVTNAFSSSSAGIDTFIVEFLSQDSIDDLRSHFKDAFEGQSWTQSFQSESNGQVFDTYAENDDGTGTAVTVTISESDVSGYNTVGLTVASQ